MAGAVDCVLGIIVGGVTGSVVEMKVEVVVFVVVVVVDVESLVKVVVEAVVDVGIDVVVDVFVEVVVEISVGNLSDIIEGVEIIDDVVFDNTDLFVSGEAVEEIEAIEVSSVAISVVKNISEIVV